MSHQYKVGDVVTVFQVSASKELVIEGKATIRKRVAEVDEQYRVEFVNKPGATYERFVDSWGQDDPEKYLRDFNNRLCAINGSAALSNGDGFLRLPPVRRCRFPDAI